MHYWRDQSFKNLSEIAGSQDIVQEFPLYAKYCEQRAKGLRKLYLDTLNSFIAEALTWPDEKKFHFVSWVYSVGTGKSFIDDLIPHPLYQKFIKPVLSLWTAKEPNNPEPLRLINTFESLRKALKLNPLDEVAAEKFFKKAITQVEYSIHELPEHGYLGQVQEELELLQECINTIDELKSKKVLAYKSKILSLKALVTSWKDFKDSQSQTTFKEWAIEKGRIYDLK